MYRRSLLVRAALMTLILGVTGCDDSDGEGASDGDGGGANGGGDGGSCGDYNGTTECLEYTGVDWDQTSASYHCQGMQGVYSTDPCDTTGAVGRCSISVGDPLEYFHYYYENAAEAEQACALNSGVWEPL